MGQNQLVSNVQRIMREEGLNPTRWSKLAGVGRTAVRDIIDGKSQNPRYVTLEKLAKAAGRSTAELAAKPRDGIAMVGRTTADGLIVPTEKAERIAGEALDTPSAESGHETVLVKGKGLEPIYQDGDLLFYRRPQDSSDLRSCYYRTCVVEDSRGRLLVRKVMPGVRPDSVSLVPIARSRGTVARVKWAAPVLWVKRA